MFSGERGLPGPDGAPGTKGNLTKIFYQNSIPNK